MDLRSRPQSESAEFLQCCRRGGQAIDPLETPWKTAPEGERAPWTTPRHCTFRRSFPRGWWTSTRSWPSNALWNTARRGKRGVVRGNMTNLVDQQHAVRLVSPARHLHKFLTTSFTSVRNIAFCCGSWLHSLPPCFSCLPQPVRPKIFPHTFLQVPWAARRSCWVARACLHTSW